MKLLRKVASNYRKGLRPLEAWRAALLDKQISQLKGKIK